jgi:hypothetical protein
MLRILSLPRIRKSKTTPKPRKNAAIPKKRNETTDFFVFGCIGVAVAVTRGSPLALEGPAAFSFAFSVLSEPFASHKASDDVMS